LRHRKLKASVVKNTEESFDPCRQRKDFRGLKMEKASAKAQFPRGEFPKPSEKKAKVGQRRFGRHHRIVASKGNKRKNQD